MAFTVQMLSNVLCMSIHVSTDGYTIAQIAHDFKRGGEQNENPCVGSENLKRVHIDGVIEEIRNRKIYDKQHRKW